MAGKKKTVYFYTGVEKDEDGKDNTWQFSYWKKFLDGFKQGESPKYSVRGSDCTGEVRDNIIPEATYFHLMRERKLSDWPEGRSNQGNVENLAAAKDDLGLAEIYEYAYLMPVSDTPYVAVFRSSGGPRPGMLGDWIATYKDSTTIGHEFMLVPVLRLDAMEKLTNAIGVKSLYARIEGIPEESDEGSAIERGVAVAGETLSEDAQVVAKIDLNISLGRLSAANPGTESLLKEAEKTARRVGVQIKGSRITALKAKTLQQDENDKILVDPVDFFKDRMTVTAEFGDSLDDVMTPDQILTGMYAAIGEFRKRMV